MKLVLVHHVALFRQRLYLKILAIMKVFTLEIITTHGENKVTNLNVRNLREMTFVRVNWTMLIKLVQMTTKAKKLNGAEHMSGTESRAWKSFRSASAF